jgi:hypothetical protein
VSIRKDKGGIWDLYQFDPEELSLEYNIKERKETNSSALFVAE